MDQLVELQQYKPSLPQTAAVWTRILARLMEQKQFMAVAFLTVGFGEVRPPISCLDHACPFEVDCSSGHVEEVRVPCLGFVGVPEIWVFYTLDLLCVFP